MREKVEPPLLAYRDLPLGVLLTGAFGLGHFGDIRLGFGQASLVVSRTSVAMQSEFQRRQVAVQRAAPP